MFSWTKIPSPPGVSNKSISYAQIYKFGSESNFLFSHFFSPKYHIFLFSDVQLFFPGWSLWGNVSIVLYMQLCLKSLDAVAAFTAACLSFHGHEEFLSHDILNETTALVPLRNLMWAYWYIDDRENFLLAERKKIIYKNTLKEKFLHKTQLKSLSYFRCYSSNPFARTA